MNKDNETLEKIAKILLKTNEAELSDSKALTKIMKIVTENLTRKLKETLGFHLRKNSEEKK